MAIFIVCVFLCRHEVKLLKKNHGNESGAGTSTGPTDVSNRERLTIDWFSKVIAEFRSELVELQEVQSNTTRRLQQRNQCAEELLELRDDFGKLKLESNAIRLRQDNLDQAIKELQAEAIQRDDDFRRSQLQVSVETVFASLCFFSFTSCYYSPHRDEFINWFWRLVNCTHTKKQ